MLDLRAILKQAGDAVGRPEGMTAVYVTHDQAEAFAIADRVVVMNNGRVEQDGLPTDLYRHPATPFVARFLGMDNILEGEIMSADPLIVRTALGEWRVTSNAISPSSPHSCTLLIRPDAGRLLTKDGYAENVVHGRLDALSFRGRYQIATVSSLQSPVSLKLEFDTAVSLPSAGAEMRIAIDGQAIQLLKSD
jgi:ABC-type Fe3+/spermidine/putrescine transport system ATPase subunit